MEESTAETSQVLSNPRSRELMKRRSILAGLAVAACLLSTGGEAFAQVFNITITVDENGNGTLTNTNGFFSALPFTVAPDLGPGGLPAALTYNLLGPPGLVAGDLLLLEPGPFGVLTDLIRFNATNGTMVFYSDNTDGAPSLADKGFPTALYANNIARTEVGDEGSNGFSYTPTAGQPGFVAGAGGPVTYVIRSDVAVPEPGTLTLCGLAALAGLATAVVRRKRTA
jgi:hypothetical protein